MAKLLRRLAVGSGVLLLLLLTAGYGVYRAATNLPPEYEALLLVNQDQQDARRQELESQLAALYSQSSKPVEPESPSVWDIWVTDYQINAWLATRLNEEMPSLAADGVLDPRVAFAEDVLTLAFRLDQGRLSAVVTFRVTPFLSEDGRLGIELSETKVGSVPLPTSRIVELSRPLLEEAGVPVEWSTIEGQPVLLVEFEKLASEPRMRRSLTALEVGDGELYIAGETKQRDPQLARLLRSIERQE